MNDTTPDNTIAALARHGRARLAGLDSARLDADLLLCAALGRSRTWLHTWPEKRATAAQSQHYLASLERRAAGVPLAYLTGAREFWSLQLEVTEATLVPRDDTETLVAAALPHVRPGHVVLDLGTGSGAVALALCSERPAARIVASDIDCAALAVARRNAVRLGLTVTFVQSDWLTAFGAAFADVIVANPPYVAGDDPHLGHDGVRCEPRLALVAGADGLDALRSIAKQAPRCLRERGWLAVEHGATQGAAVRALMRERHLSAIRTVADGAGLERVTLGCRTRAMTAGPADSP